ncbi:DUF3168 domain-containing protein [Aliikangiella marina]|uniref:DUF3168 domain-containing protein n=1 Tax=Aliikangiella marina TaxID=1712262 RepID=A0A545THI4_9GAMM|nr:DUF3168 domain-containing protein [Aliikangiella marina]TQV76672.1 DUF3168 domain-containing protein [Aliikangiella marina]
MEKELRDRLENDPVLSGMIDERLYPMAAPETARGSVIVYEVYSSEVDRLYDGRDGEERVSVRFTAWDARYNKAKAIAKEINRLLDEFQGTIGNIEFLEIYRTAKFSNYDSGEKSYGQVLEYQLTYKEVI